MAVTSIEYMHSTYNRMKAQGNKAVNSDFYFEIEGFEESGMLIKQAPWPVPTIRGEIEVPLPMGGMSYQQQNLKTEFSGPITLSETEAGTVNKMVLDIIRSRTMFNARIYNGDKLNYTLMKRIQDAFIVLDTPDRDWENRSQVLTISGTIFFHYFGKDEVGPGLR